MIHIVSLAILGMLAGMIAGFWTRIITPGMILGFLTERWDAIFKDKLFATGDRNQAFWHKFLSCIFCLSPWLCFAFDTAYIIIYTPNWVFCVIGVLASLGAGNFFAEVIYSARNDR